ncbi:glutamyl-tRNA(Gln) amidotransferase subunit C, chloroplastic/mitochondrial-like [Trifolium pratense]|uniref:glutamyl-tRNA(Gln) amidotransferase subunit C, chloroplastic/mitochondrial-like n=1 Tax=Trifolium pratense TaxID=57577 RepID=UPI001E694083|nr:glutamyl-tRNA(Gln) amidotransferase subunit C, chloroplastic/mitochondrial-like [Trifolium pratense]
MSSKVLYFRGTPLTTLWNPKIQHKLLQFRRLSSKTINCCSLQPPNVSHLAKTAHISLTPTEVEEFGPKIQQVIGWFGQLQGVDLQSIEPSIRADTENNLRDNTPEAFDQRDAIIASVPSYEEPYIKVPKVLNVD